MQALTLVADINANNYACVLLYTQALEADLHALKQLTRAQAQLSPLEAQHDAAVAEHERLVNERYSRLSTALQDVNAKMSVIYRTLTAGQGDCYCSYTLERHLLFSEGVSLHVRPDQHRWRQFASLSGGQQALAALALSFALQVGCHSVKSKHAGWCI